MSTRLQHDSAETHARLTKLQNDHETAVRVLETELRAARESSESRELELARARDELASKTRVYEELCARHEALERELEEMRGSWETTVERRVREREAEFVAKFAEMDARLNEARREQTKAAVMVRQVERSATREKDRLEAMLKSCDAYYKEHLARLNDKVKSLERERNTLVTSMRQHGIANFST